MAVAASTTPVTKAPALCRVPSLPGVPVPPRAGTDPWHIDVGMWEATGYAGNWDFMLYHDLVVGAGPYLWGGFSTGKIYEPETLSSRWWDIDFGAAGVWDALLVHVTGFDVGIYSFRIDGVEFQRIDGYSAADVNNIEVVAAGLRISAGWHRFSVHIIGFNPSCTGDPWYAALQGVQFRRSAVAAPGSFGLSRGRPSPAVPAQVVDVPVLFPVDNYGVDNVIAGPAADNIRLESSLHALSWVEWDANLDVGYWDLFIHYVAATTMGTQEVRVNGVLVGTFAAYSAAATPLYDERFTARRVLITKPGLQRIRIENTTGDGSAPHWYIDVTKVQFRQVGGRVTRAKRMTQSGPWFPHGNTNWATNVATKSQVMGAFREGAGTNGDTVWWWVTLEAGLWSLDLAFLRDPVMGIVTVYLDDEVVGRADLYKADPRVYNDLRSIHGILVRSSGRHRLRFTMTGKNASATNYYGDFSYIGFRKVPDVLVADVQVPVMTDNANPRGWASANNSYAGAEPYCAFNPAAGSGYGWLSKEGGVPAWIGYQFPTPTIIAHYAIRPWWYGGASPGLARSPKSWVFQGSNDGGGTWTDLDSVTNWSWGGNYASVITFAVDSPAAFTKYRLYVTAIDSGSNVGLGSLQMTVA